MVRQYNPQIRAILNQTCVLWNRSANNNAKRRALILRKYDRWYQRKSTLIWLRNTNVLMVDKSIQTGIPVTTKPNAIKLIVRPILPQLNGCSSIKSYMNKRLCYAMCQRKIHSDYLLGKSVATKTEPRPCISESDNFCCIHVNIPDYILGNINKKIGTSIADLAEVNSSGDKCMLNAPYQPYIKNRKPLSYFYNCFKSRALLRDQKS